jgi:hypothetical protein
MVSTPTPTVPTPATPSLKGFGMTAPDRFELVDKPPS